MKKSYIAISLLAVCAAFLFLSAESASASHSRRYDNCYSRCDRYDYNQYDYRYRSYEPRSRDFTTSGYYWDGSRYVYRTFPTQYGSYSPYYYDSYNRYDYGYDYNYGYNYSSYNYGYYNDYSSYNYGYSDPYYSYGGYYSWNW